MESPQTMEDLVKQQSKERDLFVKDCPHTKITIEDEPTASGRNITLRCSRCRLNLLTYIVDVNMSYLSYVQHCVNGHPDSRKHGVTATNEKNIFDVLEAEKKAKEKK